VDLSFVEFMAGLDDPALEEQSRSLVDEILFGPERQSLVSSDVEASKGERLLRDWFGSEQEFKAAGQAASEGRAGAALGWGALALAGAVPVAGKALKGAAKALGAVPEISKAVKVSTLPRYNFEKLRDYRGVTVRDPDVLTPVQRADFNEGKLRLFHSTTERNLDAIRAEGLKESFPRFGDKITRTPAVYGSSSPEGLNLYGDWIVEYVVPMSRAFDLELSTVVSPAVPPVNIAAFHRFDGENILETLWVNPGVRSVFEAPVSGV